MRVRKKPDLRVNIPSYPNDYVEMPPETKRLILEANRTPNDIKYIDEDENSPEVSFRIGSPDPPDERLDGVRTPEVKITEPDGMRRDNAKKNENGEVESVGADSPVVYRNPLKRGSVSVPIELKTYNADQQNKHQLNVSNLITDFDQ